MQRYFIQFSYCGRYFNGLQSQTLRMKNISERSSEELSSFYTSCEDTVQGALESAVWHTVRPSNLVKISTSCRTDTGVHALHNTGHFDLLPPHHTKLHPSPRILTKNINSWLMKRRLNIQVSSVLGVPASFHSRHDVISRSYLYRLAVFPNQLNIQDDSKRFHQWIEWPFNAKKRRRKDHVLSVRNHCVMSRLSLLENQNIFDFNLKPDESFNTELFEKTLKLMEGTHNFSNFSKTQGLFKYKTVDGKRYTPVPRTVDERTRTISKIEVFNRGSPLPSSVYPVYSDNDVKFLDVVVQGQSFLHNQIRRMIGAALAVATDKVSLALINDLLNNPDRGWDPSLTPAQSRGLYLARVEYAPETLALATDKYEDMIKLDKIAYDPSMDGDRELEESCDDGEDLLIDNTGVKS